MGNNNSKTQVPSSSATSQQFERNQDNTDYAKVEKLKTKINKITQSKDGLLNAMTQKKLSEINLKDESPYFFIKNSIKQVLSHIEKMSYTCRSYSTYNVEWYEDLLSSSLGIIQKATDKVSPPIIGDIFYSYLEKVNSDRIKKNFEEIHENIKEYEDHKEDYIEIIFNKLSEQEGSCAQLLSNEKKILITTLKNNLLSDKDLQNRLISIGILNEEIAASEEIEYALAEKILLLSSPSNTSIVDIKIELTGDNKDKYEYTEKNLKNDLQIIPKFIKDLKSEMDNITERRAQEEAEKKRTKYRATQLAPAKIADAVLSNSR